MYSMKLEDLSYAKAQRCVWQCETCWDIAGTPRRVEEVQSHRVLLIGHMLPSELHPTIILGVAGWHMPRLSQKPELLLCSRAQWNSRSQMPKLDSYSLWFSSTGTAKEPKLVAPGNCWWIAANKTRGGGGGVYFFALCGSFITYSFTFLKDVLYSLS